MDTGYSIVESSEKSTAKCLHKSSGCCCCWILLSIVHGILPAAPLAMAETDTESESQQPTNRQMKKKPKQTKSESESFLCSDFFYIHFLLLFHFFNVLFFLEFLSCSNLFAFGPSAALPRVPLFSTNLAFWRWICI